MPVFPTSLTETHPSTKQNLAPAAAQSSAAPLNMARSIRRYRHNKHSLSPRCPRLWVRNLEACAHLITAKLPCIWLLEYALAGPQRGRTPGGTTAMALTLPQCSGRDCNRNRRERACLRSQSSLLAS